MQLHEWKKTRVYPTNKIQEQKLYKLIKMA